MVVSVYCCQIFSDSVGPITVKYSSLREREYFHNLKKMLLNRNSKAQLNNAGKNQPMMMVIINILITSSVSKLLLT